MITINATLGTGLYWRGGQVLEVGGALAVPLTFLLVGCLSWAVMQCISEMLCIWPVPGALGVFVGEFVDEELGIATSIAHWFTYAMSFSTLVPTAAGELDFWPGITGNRLVLGGVIYFLIPVALLFVNLFKVETYGIFEVVSGSIKMLFLVTIAGILIAINRGGKLLTTLLTKTAGPDNTGPIGIKYEDWSQATAFDKNAAGDSWFTALLMCISIATFAYVGVEVVAASALEAEINEKPSNNAPFSRSKRLHVMNSTVKFSAIYIPVITTVGYTISGLLASLDMKRNNCGLPKPTWLSIPYDALSNCTGDGTTDGSRSVFVLIAADSHIPHLDDVVNFFLVFTCLTANSTNLYIASRALFGLASRLDEESAGRWHLRFFAWFGTTNSNRVPVRALVFSAAAFGWIPFLQLIHGIDATSGFIEILGEMASVSTLIVWACECLAFIRFYNCVRRHRKYIELQDVPLVQRWSEDPEKYPEYPYRSIGQPYLAYFALAACLFVLLISNGATLWNGFHWLSFLSSYLTILAFLGLWILLKLERAASWSFVNLSEEIQVVAKLRGLNRFRASLAQSQG
ncbi:proline-specific permease [Penicillium angulare]|uniref:Proline-specific permease n=1 Tax=Penicillium angulare TaxID=116970 RepID=A0A9W9FVN5_9EURO|nr:proline-specific permease [Penicillium angulare]